MVGGKKEEGEQRKRIIESNETKDDFRERRGRERAAHGMEEGMKEKEMKTANSGGKKVSLEGFCVGKKLIDTGRLISMEEGFCV